MAKRINVLDNLVKLPKYGARTMSLDIANFKSKWEYLKLLIKLAGMNIMSDKRLRKNDIIQGQFRSEFVRKGAKKRH